MYVCIICKNVPIATVLRVETRDNSVNNKHHSREKDFGVSLEEVLLLVLVLFLLENC